MNVILIHTTHILLLIRTPAIALLHLNVLLVTECQRALEIIATDRNLPAVVAFADSSRNQSLDARRFSRREAGQGIQTMDQLSAVVAVIIFSTQSEPTRQEN